MDEKEKQAWDEIASEQEDRFGGYRKAVEEAEKKYGEEIEAAQREAEERYRQRKREASEKFGVISDGDGYVYLDDVDYDDTDETEEEGGE